MNTKPGCFSCRLQSCTHLGNFVQEFVVFLSFLKSAQIAAHSRKQGESTNLRASPALQGKWAERESPSRLEYCLSSVTSVQKQTNRCELKAEAGSACSPPCRSILHSAIHTEFPVSSWQHSPCLRISAHDYTDSSSWILIVPHWLFMTEHVSRVGCHSCCWWQMNIH